MVIVILVKLLMEKKLTIKSYENFCPPLYISSLSNLRSGDEDESSIGAGVGFGTLPHLQSPKDNSLSPGFDDLSNGKQIDRLQKMHDSNTSSRRKALLDQLKATETTIARRPKKV
jgi:hypothetical protein